MAAIVFLSGCSGDPVTETADSPKAGETLASEPVLDDVATDEGTVASSAPNSTEEPVAGKSNSVTVPTMNVDAFLQAARAGNADAISSGLRQGIDVNSVGESEQTALQLASFDGHTDAVRLLLKNGSKIDQLDASGRTALMFASTGANADTVKALLAANANVHIVDKLEQFTALMFAAAEGQADVVRLLLDAGANPAKKDVDGESALDFARVNGHADVIRLLTK